jgi:hypothetical protein
MCNLGLYVGDRTVTYPETEFRYTFLEHNLNFNIPYLMWLDVLLAFTLYFATYPKDLLV